MISRAPFAGPAGLRSFSGVGRPPVVPPVGTITNLAATPGDGQVSLTWTPAANATSHQPQYRAQGSGTWNSYGSPLSGAAGSVTITGLQNGTEYQFRVVASDGSTTTESNIATATPQATPSGVILYADFEDGTLGGLTRGGSSTHGPYEIMADPTPRAQGNVVRLRYLAGTGSDVDNYLAWNPSPSNPIGAGDTIYSYGKFFVVDNGYTGNRKLWRYYVGPQGSNASDLTIWMSTTLRIEGPLVNQGLYYQNSGATVTRNAWHELEVQMTFDSAPGAGNGSIRVWLDRVLVHEDTGLGFINAQYPTLSVVRFGYQTQSTREGVADTRYWDDIVISTERIAP